jgi:hypothetical protein
LSFTNWANISIQADGYTFLATDTVTVVPLVADVATNHRSAVIRFPTDAKDRLVLQIGFTTTNCLLRCDLFFLARV